MVSHSHLSAGNSLSSQSRDLFAEFGVSNPNSPLKVSSDMAESVPNPNGSTLVSDGF